MARASPASVRRNRHVKAFVDSLKEKFPDDTFKQMTVAGAVADRLGALEGYLDIGNYKIDADSPITKKQVEVAIACLASWREFNAKLRHIWPKGRYPNDVRAVVHATNAAMGLPTTAPAVSLARRAAAAKTSEAGMRMEAKRWKTWCQLCSRAERKGHSLLTLRGALRNDRYPQEWVREIDVMWKHPTVTRESEKGPRLLH